MNSRVYMLDIPWSCVYNADMEVNTMPSILPISDLSNYTDVLKDVDANQRVCLTRNGRGVYAIMTIQEADELDKFHAAAAVVDDLRKAEAQADKEGWVSDDEARKIMGIDE